MGARKMKKANFGCLDIRGLAPLIPTDGTGRTINFNKDGTIESIEPPLTHEEIEAAAKMTEGVEGVVNALYDSIEDAFDEI